jgi:cell division protein FtsB
MRGKITAWLLVVFGLVLVTRSGASVYRLWKTGERVEEAGRQLAAAEEENRQLTAKLKEVQTPEYMERQAREKLGYGKPGEVVIVIPDDQNPKSEILSSKEGVPNWIRWRKLYLGF